MGIQSISGNNSQIYAVGQQNDNGEKFNKAEKNSAKVKSNVKADTLVLSDEAKKFLPIKKKIESGFYDKPEVLQDVARKIDQELLSEATR